MCQKSIWDGVSELFKETQSDIPQNPPILAIDIPSESQGLTVIRHALDHALARAGVTTEDTQAFQVAVGEACANAVRYGSPDGGQSRLGVALYLQDSSVTVIVRDQGAGFDPELVPEPDFQALPEGGMGIYLMRQVMDQVKFRFMNGGTWVILSKQLCAEPESF